MQCRQQPVSRWWCWLPEPYPAHQPAESPELRHIRRAWRCRIQITCRRHRLRRSRPGRIGSRFFFAPLHPQQRRDHQPGKNQENTGLVHRAATRSVGTTGPALSGKGRMGASSWRAALCRAQQVGAMHRHGATDAGSVADLRIGRFCSCRARHDDVIATGQLRQEMSHGIAQHTFDAVTSDRTRIDLARHRHAQARRGIASAPVQAQ